MPGPVVRSGERVSLRPPGVADLDILQRAHGDPTVRRSMPRVDTRTRADTREEDVDVSDAAVGLLVRADDAAVAERPVICAPFRIDADGGTSSAARTEALVANAPAKTQASSAVG